MRKKPADLNSFIILIYTDKKILFINVFNCRIDNILYHCKVKT